MLVTGLLQRLAEILFLVISAILNDFTRENVIDIEVRIDVD